MGRNAGRKGVMSVVGNKAVPHSGTIGELDAVTRTALVTALPLFCFFLVLPEDGAAALALVGFDEGPGCAGSNRWGVGKSVMVGYLPSLHC